VTGTEPLARTRRSLHGIAELVLAGPQYRSGGRIRLKITPGGFGTTAGPELRMDGGELVSGTRRVTATGLTYASLASRFGLEAGAPQGLYPGGSGVDPHETVVLDLEAVETIARAFADGADALRRFAPEATPVLWPEHFDLGITLDEVNYGVSPGDEHLPVPYAYVGPHQLRQGPFWNAPFGASRPLGELGEGITRFFEQGRLASA
jgi:hypothetical protein